MSSWYSVFMLASTCIVVPTYWTRKGGAYRVGDAIYDHPTPLGGPSTLDPLLESLTRLDTSKFYVLLLVAVTSPEVAIDAEREVQALAARYPALTTIVFGESALGALHEWLSAHQLGAARAFLDLREYPKIRNLQLALPLALQSHAIVALDDDEIVTDLSFLAKATEPLGRLIGEVRADGLSGHYEQIDGGIQLKVDPDKANSPNLFDRKAVIMNEATDMLEAESGMIVPTPFCFGGNMEFTPELARSVGFDPGITRGEDIDYLINARIEGKQFFLHKDLRIVHRPPPGGSYLDSNTSKLEQDVIRFMYEREKLAASLDHASLKPITVESLMPYPGRFLQNDLESNASEALRAAGYAGDPDAFIQHVRSGLSDRLALYLEFRARWPEAMHALSDAREIRELLLGRVSAG